MYKLLISVVFFFGIFSVNAQEETEEDKDTIGWSSEGKFQILFNQSAFNKEWTGGGTSSIAGNATLDYDLNYRRGDITWSTKILANYGLTRTEASDFFRKTSDRLEINSTVGKQLKESYWFYSFFTNFRTQIDKGYQYANNPDTGEESRTEFTTFLSPAYLQFGPGILWKKNEDFFFNIAPSTARFIFVDPRFTSSENYEDGRYFGISKGESTRFEWGASLTGYSKFEIIENVMMENTISLYSNYLENADNIDLDYLLNLEMEINNFLTTNLIFQAIYDDNAVGAFQIREVFGLGFNINF